MSQKQIKKFRRETRKIVEQNEALFSMQMFKQILLMPFRMRFMIAMKIIFKFNKKQTAQAPALVQKFGEFKKEVQALTR